MGIRHYIMLAVVFLSSFLAKADAQTIAGPVRVEDRTVLVGNSLLDVSTPLVFRRNEGRRDTLRSTARIYMLLTQVNEYCMRSRSRIKKI